MKPLSPETRALLDDLRAVERVTPLQVDHAWQRFAARQVRRRRWVMGLWLVGATAAAGAASVLLVPSLRARVSEVAGEREPSEASHQREPEPPRTLERAAIASQGAASTEPSAVLEPVPVPAGAGSRASSRTDEPAGSSSLDRREGSRATRGSTSQPQGSPAPSLAAELALLDDAEQAFREGALDRAERLLDDHRERFPAGALGEERRMLESRIVVAREERSN